MKLGENVYIMRQLFSPSFMRIGQKLWIFYYWPIFESVPFFFLRPYFKDLYCNCLNSWFRYEFCIVPNDWESNKSWWWLKLCSSSKWINLSTHELDNWTIDLITFLLLVFIINLCKCWLKTIFLYLAFTWESFQEVELLTIDPIKWHIYVI